MMQPIKTTVTCRGTVIITDRQGTKHEGFVGTKYAGQKAEVLKMDSGQWLASMSGEVKAIQKYTGEDGQQKLF